MTALFLVAGLIYALVVLRMALCEREIARRTGPGTLPGEGDLIVEGGWFAGGPGGGHFSFARVTRDPVEYVRKASRRGPGHQETASAPEASKRERNNGRT